MSLKMSRFLLAVAAAILVVGGGLHAAAFFKTAASGLDGSNLPRFFVAELKVLWLGDSTTLIGVGLVYALLAAAPDRASSALVFMVTIVPAATTALLYLFLGGFYAAHLLLMACLLAVSAGWLLRGGRARSA